MRVIKVEVKNCRPIIFKSSDRVVRNTQNFAELQVSFDDAWDGFQKFAMFSCGSESPYRIEITEDETVAVPNACLVSDGPVGFAFYGLKGDQRITSTTAFFRCEPTFDLDSEPPTDAVKSIQQMLDDFMKQTFLTEENVRPIVAEAVGETVLTKEEAAETYLKKGEPVQLTPEQEERLKGKDGPPGPEGPPGKDGEQGPPGKDGANGKDGTNGTDGKDGADGPYYIPSVDLEGNLTWAPSRSGLPAIPSANIMGPQGPESEGGSGGMKPVDFLNLEDWTPSAIEGNTIYSGMVTEALELSIGFSETNFYTTQVSVIMMSLLADGVTVAFPNGTQVLNAPESLNQLARYEFDIACIGGGYFVTVTEWPM